MTNLQQMTNAELKKYLSDHRDDDQHFSEALSELLKRDPNPIIYPADLPLGEIERILKAKIEETKQN